MSKYSPDVMESVRQRLGLDEDDESRDKDIEAMTCLQLLDHCLCWEGIIGYTSLISGLVEDIYGVKLKEERLNGC